MQAHYKCPTCGATKTIVKPESQYREQFIQQLPERVPCYWQGCSDYCIPTIPCPSPFGG